MSGSVNWNWPPKTILVAVDFGDASARALAIAGVLRKALGSRLRVIHAERFEPPPYFTLEQLTRLEADRRAAQGAARDHLAAFARVAGAGEVEFLVEDAAPVDAILDAAATADLIVLGTHGRRGPGRWWLGSVAERVVREAAVPVLVTRASAAPVEDVFARVTFVGDAAGAPGGRPLADHLAHIGAGAVGEGGTVAACATDIVHASTLVVVALEDRSWSMFNDTASKILTSCQAPVLFVPVAVSERITKLEGADVR